MTTEIRETKPISATTSAAHRRIAVLIALILSVGIQAGFFWELRVSIANGFTDFQEYYGAAMVVRSGHAQQLYDPSVQSSVQQSFTHRTLAGFSSSHYFNHAPYEVLIYLLLTWVSFVHAAWCWWAVNLLLLYSGLYLLLPFLPLTRARLQWAVLGTATFVPLFYTEIQGQDTILTLFLFIVCFISLARDRYAMAGAALAITMYKPPLALPMLLMVALTSRKRLSVLGGFLGTSAILFLLSVTAVGWNCTITYPKALASFARSEGGHLHLDELPNLRGLANSLFEAHLSQRAIFLIVATVSALVLALTVWFVRSTNWQSETRTLHFALIVLATLLVGYQEYVYDMTLLLLPMLFLWEWTGSEARRTSHRKLLIYALAGLLCVSALALVLVHTQVFACALVVVFLLGCRETRHITQPI